MRQRDVLLWADVPGVDARDVYAAPLPRDRPARHREPTDGAPVAPWIRMPDGDLRALLVSTQAAWDAYVLASEQGAAPIEPATVLVARDGSRWVLSATGRPEPA